MTRRWLRRTRYGPAGLTAPQFLTTRACIPYCPRRRLSGQCPLAAPVAPPLRLAKSLAAPPGPGVARPMLVLSPAARLNYRREGTVDPTRARARGFPEPVVMTQGTVAARDNLDALEAAYQR